MTHQPPLDLTLPAGVRATPRWEYWQRAFDDLRARPGQLWIVCPFITTLPEGTDLSGARVLTTLDARKIATDAVSLDVLKRAAALGVQVRILPELHAKVYLKEGGGDAVGHLGSANLTVRAERHNKEAMAGPHRLPPAFLEQLHAHWEAATPMTSALVEQVRREAEGLRLNQDVQRQAETDLVVFSVSVTLFGSGFTLTEERVGVPKEERTPGLVPARVDFVSARHRKAGVDLLREGMGRAFHGEHGTARALPGHGRLYVVPLQDAERFRQQLGELDRALRTKMLGLRDASAEVWRTDFLARLEQAASRYTKAHPVVLAEVVRDADQEFGHCMARGEVAVQFAEFLPLHGAVGEANPYQRTYRAVRDQQPLRWDEQEAVP